MAFSTKIKGNHHLQGNVQVYNVRIPVQSVSSQFQATVPVSRVLSAFYFPIGQGIRATCRKLKAMVPGLQLVHVFCHILQMESWKNSAPDAKQ